MKTYILRDPQPVEPQDPLRSEPGIVALADTIVGPQTLAPPCGGLILYVGLDVHNDSIAVALAPHGHCELHNEYGEATRFIRSFTSLSIFSSMATFCQ